ncbi:hypothetical protein [Desulfovibrio sp. ZJ200]|uniref:hypothetical protein n=1 Tax=Desulfovibrio sp. ZJ200 TaxID=2709792 RepID=UPI00197DB03B|nr:hypothetical protein [Desulfovibrio sp. ZJ200]
MSRLQRQGRRAHGVWRSAVPALPGQRSGDARELPALRQQHALSGLQGQRAGLEHFHFENALLTRKRQPPQRGVHSGENRVFRLNATFDFHKKSKVICSRVSPQ